MITATAQRIKIVENESVKQSVTQEQPKLFSKIEVVFLAVSLLYTLCVIPFLLQADGMAGMWAFSCGISLALAVHWSHGQRGRHVAACIAVSVLFMMMCGNVGAVMILPISVVSIVIIQRLSRSASVQQFSNIPQGQYATPFVASQYPVAELRPEKRGILWPFQRIGFKMAWSYIIVTTTSVVVLEVLVAAFLWVYLFSSNSFLDNYASSAAMIAPRLSDLLNANPIDNNLLHERLERDILQVQSDVLPASLLGSRLQAAVTDAQGKIIACAPGVSFQAGRPLSDQLTPDDIVPLNMLLARTNEQAAITRRTDQGNIVYVTRLVNPAGHTTGILYLHASKSNMDPNVFLTIVSVFILITLPIAFLYSALFSGVYSRNAGGKLARRINILSSLAVSWSRGDFSTGDREKSQDELGELSRRMHDMAIELQRHVSAQQKLAVIQERNRLARDLHDTVKQQAFAAAMQLGAARTVLAEYDGPAAAFITQAEKLTNKVQEDLMTIIHELQPEASISVDKSLATILRACALEWSQTSGIPTDVRTTGEFAASLEVKQGLLRILQEALANVARHSGAGRVDIELGLVAEGSLQLKIADNGAGFDPATTPRGMGLNSMRDRARSLPSGSFALEAAPGSGVALIVTCKAGGADNV